MRKRGAFAKKTKIRGCFFAFMCYDKTTSKHPTKLFLVLFAEFLGGDAKHLFELAVAIGNVGKTNVGCDVAKGFVGNKQQPNNLAEFVANGVVNAGRANKFFEQLHQVKLAIATLVGKLTYNKLVLLRVHNIKHIFDDKQLLVQRDVFGGCFVVQPMQDVLDVNQAHVCKVFVLIDLHNRLANLLVSFVLWCYNAIHVGCLWVGKCVFVVLQCAQVDQKAIDNHVLLVLQGVQRKRWQHNNIPLGNGKFCTIGKQRATARQHFCNKKLFVPHCRAKRNGIRLAIDKVFQRKVFACVFFE